MKRPLLPGTETEKKKKELLFNFLNYLRQITVSVRLAPALEPGPADPPLLVPGAAEEDAAVPETDALVVVGCRKNAIIFTFS